MTATVTPIRSNDQRLEALQMANAERSQKATIKRQLKRGEISPFDVLLAPPSSLGVIEFLVSLPRVGKVKSRRFCREARISTHKKIVGLSERQKNELSLFITDRAVDGLRRAA